jgi:hypothetical protein
VAGGEGGGPGEGGGEGGGTGGAREVREVTLTVIPRAVSSMVFLAGSSSSVQLPSSPRAPKAVTVAESPSVPKVTHTTLAPG